MKPILQERVALPTFDGRDRYFWRNPDMPWWMLSTHIRNLELARVHRPLYAARHVYHYTTVAAFKSIIDSQELWLTDYAYLNDSSEVRHGLELAREVFEQDLSAQTPTYAACSKGSWHFHRTNNRAYSLRVFPLLVTA